MKATLDQPLGESETWRGDAVAVCADASDVERLKSLVERFHVSYNQPQMQNLINKMDELLTAMRRP